MWSSQWNGNWQRKMEYSKETCPRVILSITNLTKSYLGSNPVLRRENLATNCMSHDTIRWYVCMYVYIRLIQKARNSVILIRATCTHTSREVWLTPATINIFYVCNSCPLFCMGVDLGLTFRY
jgi:hypothetical protein